MAHTQLLCLIRIIDMPPYYDIYGITKRRDINFIEKVIKYYGDRDALENQEGSEILLDPHDKYEQKEANIPIKTLGEVIKYGVEHPTAGFSFYLGKKTLRSPHTDLILRFTYDCKLIIGVSVEDTDEQGNDNLYTAKQVELALKDLLTTEKTFVQLECAPPDDENDFDEETEASKNYGNQYGDIYKK